MLNHKGSLLVCIDTETTGTDVELDEVWQVAMIPLNDNLDPVEHLAVQWLIKPEVNITSPYAAKASIHGLTQDQAMDAFEDWVERLNFSAEWSRILPVGHNYKDFDRPMLEKLYGSATYGLHFHGFCRDTMDYAHFINDRCELRGHKPLFPDVKLSSLAKALDIPYDQASLHDALYDTLLTAKIYKKLCWLDLTAV
ncbi:MAG: hypothetical protein CL489_06200 [Acidobacteria bacterium]|nr:hypothetical protein [Acidobacteriota bacterium]|tara:strand:- start:31833 stop:32420 length:588 start_codon:yes stop_codon:yes gene_type:complete